MRVIKVLVLGLLGSLILGGCDVWDPNPPDLIFPEDGAVFTTETPVFVWRESNRAVSYQILITYTDEITFQEPFVELTIEDTTYELPEDIFTGAPAGNYHWKVASVSEDGESFWRIGRSFSFNKILPAVDLDTTYFPYGLEYTWVYEFYNYGYGISGDGGEYYDTISYIVTDSVLKTTGYVFTMTKTDSYGNEYQWEIRFFGNLPLFRKWIPVVPNELTDYGIDVNYSGDTLYLSDGYYLEHEGGVGYTSEGWHSHRVRGMGEISSGHGYANIAHGGEEDYTDYRLLYFIKGADTVWRCEDCP